MEKSKTKEISWTAPEFIHYPKSLTWFVFVSLAGLALIVFFVIKKDFLTATLFLLLLILTYFFSSQTPKSLKIKINQAGLTVNEQKIPFDQLKKFWIVYEPPAVKTLNFETSAYLNRYLTLQLADQDPVALREFLLQHLIEDKARDEQLGDKIARKLKF